MQAGSSKSGLLVAMIILTSEGLTHNNPYHLNTHID
jgi:hypothetical protein